jgi:hypothetical protein
VTIVALLLLQLTLKLLLQTLKNIITTLNKNMNKYSITNHVLRVKNGDGLGCNAAKLVATGSVSDPGRS